MEKILPEEHREEWMRLLLISKFGIDEVETKLNIINEEYHFLHAYNPIEHIISRTKELDHIIDKLERKGVEPTVEHARKYLYDIGGVRVICSLVEDVYSIARLLSRQNDVKVLKIKDYIKSPKPNGYRSYHMVVEVPVFLTDRITPVKIEVQLRTVAMDLWASLEHKIYYKSGLEIPAELNEQLRQTADDIAAIDERLCRIKNEISHYTK